jgi:ABC-type transport system involved in multi-copper enzyme maturation permease subunit
MKTLAKEFHQQKWMLLGGCLAGCLAGLAFLFLDYFSSREIFPRGFIEVLFAGAFFAILLAAATTWHDARRGAGDFILSKPFNCRRIFVTKVALAALLLLLAMLIMTSGDFLLYFMGNVHKGFLFSATYLAIWLTWPIAVMLFALTMFLVVVTQDSAKSVLMAIGAELLAYFLLFIFVLFHMLGDPQFKDPVTYYGFWRQMMLPLLPFVGAMAAATVAFTWLAIVAMKKRWHWQPGQKTVVWAMGLSSLFIFAQIVFHVGYNLRPVTEAGGRKIRNPFSFIVASGPESTLSWPGLAEGRLKPRRDVIPCYGDAVCCKDDLMFIASMANENMMDPNTHEDACLQHAILYVYRFPYAGTPDSPVSILDLSRSPRIVPKENGSGVVIRSWIKDNWLYACYRPEKKDKAFGGDIHIVAVDIANPATPVLGGEIVVNCGAGENIFNINTVAVKGDYCYVKAGDYLAIVSLETPGEPRLAKEVPFASLTRMRMVDPESFGISGFTIVDNMLLLKTRIHLGAFDISDPANPRELFFEDARKLLGLPYNGYELSFEATWNGDYCYLATYDGLYVVKLLKDQGCGYSLKYVGVRKTTPLEKLAGHWPTQLLLYNGYLVEAAGGFGLLVYDISDPAHPRRLYHADTSGYSYYIEILNGLLDVQCWGNGQAELDNVQRQHNSVLFDLPKAPAGQKINRRKS